MNPFDSLRLATLPMSMKLLLTASLLTLGTGYIFALSNVALRVGFSPEEVTLHYYGNEATRQALRGGDEEAADAGEGEAVVEGETFSFEELESDEAALPEEALVSIPSLDALVAEGHFHLFGYTTIFFVCGLVLVFAEMRRWLKHTLIVAPFAASVLDIWSMLLTRFVGPGFAWMLMIAGMIMALSFLLVFVIGIYQLWFLHDNPPVQPAPATHPQTPPTTQ